MANDKFFTQLKSNRQELERQTFSPPIKMTPTKLLDTFERRADNFSLPSRNIEVLRDSLDEEGSDCDIQREPAPAE